MASRRTQGSPTRSIAHGLKRRKLTNSFFHTLGHFYPGSFASETRRSGRCRPFLRSEVPGHCSSCCDEPVGRLHPRSSRPRMSTPSIVSRPRQLAQNSSSNQYVSQKILADYLPGHTLGYACTPADAISTSNEVWLPRSSQVELRVSSVKDVQLSSDAWQRALQNSGVR